MELSFKTFKVQRKVKNFPITRAKSASQDVRRDTAATPTPLNFYVRTMFEHKVQLLLILITGLGF